MGGGTRFRMLGAKRGGEANSQQAHDVEMTSLRRNDGLECWGPRGPNSQQVYDVVLTLMRRNDVSATSFRRHVPTRFLINQCQIITFLTVKSDNIEIEE